MIVDPEAASVVKEIFKMTLEGKGAETIARILQERQVLIPMAYLFSKGLPRGGKKTQPNPYKWCKSTVSKILANQEYCGDVSNFKTFSKSFKNKTRFENPQENWAIFKDVHEPIIDRDSFELVQKLIAPFLRELIDRIDVYEVTGKEKNRTQRITIHYRFIGALEIPETRHYKHLKLDTRQGVAVEYLPNTATT